VDIDALCAGNESRFINDPRERRKCNVQFNAYVHPQTGEMVNKQQQDNTDSSLLR
jgi:hypothetical protein